MTILKTLETQMCAGIAPSLEQLEDALTVALQERNRFEAIARDMGQWLSKCVMAHLKQDAAGLKAVMDDFVAKNVKLIDHSNQSGSVH